MTLRLGGKATSAFDASHLRPVHKLLEHARRKRLEFSEAAIRTVQELPGHKDVHTTMIYTHVLNRGSRGVRSPADRLARQPE